MPSTLGDKSSRLPTLAFFAGLALALLAGAGTAHAAPVYCPLPEGASLALGAVEARARLDWIDVRLSNAGQYSHYWSWLWGGAIATSGVASLLAVPYVRAQDRVDWYTGAITAAIGVLPFVIRPPRVITSAAGLVDPCGKFWSALVGEAILFTQPSATIDDLRAYRAGDIRPLGPTDMALFRYSAAF